MFKATVFAALRRFSLEMPAICLTVAVSVPAVADSSPWVSGEKSRARLVSAGGVSQGVYLAGADIRLAPNSLTYWRAPGDAGVPPVFDFAGSQNVAKADVRYPAPRRFEEAGGEAFGYMDQVTFPIVVTPADPTKPVVLALKLDYATCEKICVPAQAKLSLDLKPDARDGAEAAVLREWVGRVPAPADAKAASFDIEKTQSGHWKARVPGSVSDLFAEGPDGWFFDTKRTGDGFDVTLGEKPSDSANGPVDVLFTLVEGERASEVRTRLDVPAGTP